MLEVVVRVFCSHVAFQPRWSHPVYCARLSPRFLGYHRLLECHEIHDAPNNLSLGRRTLSTRLFLEEILKDVALRADAACVLP